MGSENKNFHILVVDDEVEYQRVLSLILSEQGYTVTACASGPEALALLKHNDVQLLLTDLKMPQMSGLELIRAVKQYDESIEIMVITAFGSIESAVEAMKEGAGGYFVKSSDPPESLLADVERIARIRRLLSANQILKSQNPPPQVFLETRSPSFGQMLEVCRKAAATDISVLLLGESGVGKEVVANYIHSLSARFDQHFIAVNCQAFGDGTIESELFGHEKGSFTGAVGRRVGRFEEANWGTLFLDEVGDLPLATQGKLLRALENKAIERVGSNRPIYLDIRLISATNKELTEEIRQGRFREDFLYRINALTITVPPLRERQEDIPGLITFFLKQIEQEQKKKIHQIDQEVFQFLQNYQFPGNVRELKNILERLVALSENGRLSFQDIQLPTTPSVAKRGDAFGAELSLREARARFEAEYIQQELNRQRGNVAKSAAVLGITTRQLWNKIADYGLDTTRK